MNIQHFLSLFTLLPVLIWKSEKILKNSQFCLFKDPSSNSDTVVLRFSREIYENTPFPESPLVVVTGAHEAETWGEFPKKALFLKYFAVLVELMVTDLSARLL